VTEIAANPPYTQALLRATGFALASRVHGFWHKRVRVRGIGGGYALWVARLDGDKFSDPLKLIAEGKGVLAALFPPRNRVASGRALSHFPVSNWRVEIDGDESEHPTLKEAMGVAESTSEHGARKSALAAANPTGKYAIIVLPHTLPYVIRRDESRGEPGIHPRSNIASYIRAGIDEVDNWEIVFEGEPGRAYVEAGTARIGKPERDTELETKLRRRVEKALWEWNVKVRFAPPTRHNPAMIGVGRAWDYGKRNVDAMHAVRLGRKDRAELGFENGEQLTVGSEEAARVLAIYERSRYLDKVDERRIFSQLGASRASFNRFAVAVEGFARIKRSRGSADNPGQTLSGGGQIPASVAVLGKLTSVKLTGKGTVKPRLAGRDTVLCTGPDGRELYILPAPSALGPISGGTKDSAAGRMAKTFHGKSPEHEGQVTVTDRRIPRNVKVLGVVEEIVYEPLEGSPKARTQWFHKSGDLGPGKADTETVLASGPGNRGLYLIVTRRDGQHPVVNSRGIVG